MPVWLHRSPMDGPHQGLHLLEGNSLASLGKTGRYQGQVKADGGSGRSFATSKSPATCAKIVARLHRRSPV